jgi:hypothetical protein
MDPGTGITFGTYLLYLFFYHPDNYICLPNDRTNTNCVEQDALVCALYTGPGCYPYDYNGFCQRTMDSCSACTDPWVISYVPGECPIDDGTVCTHQSGDPVCTDVYWPVCVFKKGEGDKLEANSANSPCLGCFFDEDTLFYINGECPTVPYICKNNDPPMMCTNCLCPICSYSRCDLGICRQTKDNPCVGCTGDGTIFYVWGACPGDDPFGGD